MPSTGILEAALRAGGRPTTFRHGQALFVQGDGAERVFLIRRGWVLLTSTSGGGRDIVLGVSGPGDVVGEVGVIDGEPRSASAVAVEGVDAVVAPGSVLMTALEDRAAAHELITVLSARLRTADRQLLEFATLTTLGRVAWRLLELGDRFGEASPDGVSLALPLSQEQLASWCGASREATVKALRTLRTLGSISTARRNVVIRDVATLRRQAGGLA